MPQLKFSIQDPQAEFLSRHKELGFRDKSEMVRKSLDLLKRDIEARKLTESADLYAEIYDSEPEIREITDSALRGWPE